MSISLLALLRTCFTHKFTHVHSPSGQHIFIIATASADASLIPTVGAAFRPLLPLHHKQSKVQCGKLPKIKPIIYWVLPSLLPSCGRLRARCSATRNFLFWVEKWKSIFAYTIHNTIIKSGVTSECLCQSIM